MPIDDLAALETKLSKRGFHRIDAYLHQCPDCKQQQVIKYGIAGRTGGRDITLCLACGVAKSWRSGAGFEGRDPDPGFDLRAFLG